MVELASLPSAATEFSDEGSRVVYNLYAIVPRIGDVDPVFLVYCESQGSLEFRYALTGATKRLNVVDADDRRRFPFAVRR